MFILDTLYGDYEVSYQSNINEYIVPILVAVAILLALVVLNVIALVRIYRKANRSWFSALIPIYSQMILLEIINKPKWKIIYFLIPGVNIIYTAIAYYRLARYFRRTKRFSLMMAIFPLLFLPVLGFGSSEYIGINEEAMSGVSKAKDLPVVEEKKDRNQPDQPMKERTKVNMSIGGGVYQKEYQDSLLQAKNIKETKKPEVADFRIDPTDYQQQPKQEPVDLYQGVGFIETAQPSPAEENTSASMNTPVVNLLANSNNSNLSVIPNTEKTATTNFIDNNPTIEEKPLNNNIDSNELSFVAPITENEAQVSSLPNIFAPLQEEQKAPDTSSDSLSFQIDPTIQGLDDNKLKEQAEFIACPHCGAKVKNGATKCFMCGKPL